MPARKPLILVVDDDEDLRFLVKTLLTQAGYDVALAADGEEALALFDKLKPTLVMLDLMMPIMDGWEVLRELRSRSDVPVLMLTALNSETHQVAGLDKGADDYVTKPFTMRQLLARVSAVLRRAGYPAGLRLVFGSLVVDLSAREVRLDDQPVPLTQREFALIEVLMRNPGRVFTRADLLARCWESGYDGVDRVVDVHLASLRRKLGKHRRLIVTVHGVGYRLADE